MQEFHSTKLEIANQNLPIISSAKLNGLLAERLCWSMLREVNQVINLNSADIIEVCGKSAGAHIALLARQFPTLSFEFSFEEKESDACRILWVGHDDNLQNASKFAQYVDAIVICHEPNLARDVINAFPDFARIAAKREIANNTAISIFGRGLMRDLFKPRVRGELAA